MISRVWSSCLQSTLSWHKLDPRKRTQRVPRSRTRLPALPKARTQAKGDTINHVQCTNNMMQNMAWYAGCDMRCICMIWKGMIEPGLNLENQECHWKEELISVEIDIKITGIGCTVCKWQAKQIWHRSAINSTRPSKCIKSNKLLRPNIATMHMEVIHSRCLTKDEHWATASSQHIKLKQAWQKVQKITGSQTWWNYWTWLKQHQVAVFRACEQHGTGT